MHDPRVCVDDAVAACDRIAEFIADMDEKRYAEDAKTRAAVERQFEIIGEALNRLKRIEPSLLSRIDNAHAIIGFRNVIAHGYDVVEDEIVRDAALNDIPHLRRQLLQLFKA